jgi:hypothetical protein
MNATDKLYDAVVEQLGYDEDELKGTLEDIASHGADAGWPGFTYYSDTCAFFESNKRAIVELINEMADEFGQDVISFVAGFNCLEDDRETRDEIGRCIYGKPNDDDTQVPNALAWFALEEMARRNTDY